MAWLQQHLLRAKISEDFYLLFYMLQIRGQYTC